MLKLHFFDFAEAISELALIGLFIDGAAFLEARETAAFHHFVLAIPPVEAIKLRFRQGLPDRRVRLHTRNNSSSPAKCLGHIASGLLHAAVQTVDEVLDAVSEGLVRRYAQAPYMLLCILNA